MLTRTAARISSSGSSTLMALDAPPDLATAAPVFLLPGAESPPCGTTRRSSHAGSMAVSSCMRDRHASCDAVACWAAMRAACRCLTAATAGLDTVRTEHSDTSGAAAAQLHGHQDHSPVLPRQPTLQQSHVLVELTPAVAEAHALNVQAQPPGCTDSSTRTSMMPSQWVCPLITISFCCAPCIVMHAGRCRALTANPPMWYFSSSSRALLLCPISSKSCVASLPVGQGGAAGSKAHVQNAHTQQ